MKEGLLERENTTHVAEEQVRRCDLVQPAGGPGRKTCHGLRGRYDLRLDLMPLIALLRHERPQDNYD